MSFNINKDVKVNIIRSDRKTLSIQLKTGEIIVRAPLCMKDKEIYSFIESKKSWIEKNLAKIEKREKAISEVKPFTKEEINVFAEKAKEIMPERVKYYAPQIGVTYNRITIRCQRTRWGSCSSKGNLNFNCLLALFPIEVIDSVVVHELCHRKHMNHSPQFYTEIEKVFPEYKKWHKWLSDNGGAYIGRLPE
ncbi:MAG: M48 family metallopeptidase [Clostridia bacterium]|nr:M48 family metallopeptidase [Clostridia bacterium]